MKAYKRPVRRSVFTSVSLFSLLLCAILAGQSYLVYSHSMHAHYDAQLHDVVDHAQQAIDIEDLRASLRAGKPSEACLALRQKFADMVEDFDLSYLYVCVPVNGDPGRMINVIFVADREDTAQDPDAGFREDVYTSEELAPFLKAWAQTSGYTRFETHYEQFGWCQTVCKPLCAEDGEVVALLCADRTTAAMRREIGTYVLKNVAMAALGCFVFCAGLLMWLEKKVTSPALALGESAQRFTQAEGSAADLGVLAAEASEIRPGNEVEALAAAIAQMSREMQIYVENAQERTEYAQQEAEGMAIVAFRDPLTHVKNKTAYDAKKEELSTDVAGKRAAFAVVMLDLNDLKKINDTYGHENGNRYIVASCSILCHVYDHSPVYRIGGDEFVAILQGQDYENRDALFETLRERFEEAQNDTQREPWERCSAAAGMATYDAAKDAGVQQVFRRADERMYQNKKRMKEMRAGGPS